jgi:hypothetical protein
MPHDPLKKIFDAYTTFLDERGILYTRVTYRRRLMSVCANVPMHMSGQRNCRLARLDDQALLIVSVGRYKAWRLKHMGPLVMSLTGDRIEASNRRLRWVMALQSDSLDTDFQFPQIFETLDYEVASVVRTLEWIMPDWPGLIQFLVHSLYGLHYKH